LSGQERGAGSRGEQKVSSKGAHRFQYARTRVKSELQKADKAGRDRLSIRIDCGATTGEKESAGKWKYLQKESESLLCSAQRRS
jgi:hypothetical protein